MKEKKGFTLVELLAVVVILGVIMTIAVPKVQNALNESKQRLYDITVKDIEKAAKDYTLQYSDEVTGLEGEGIGYVTINEMITKGVLENLPKDPLTGNDFNGNYAVKIEKLDSGTYTFEYVNTQAPITGYLASEGVNVPRLVTGMTAIKWNGGTWNTVTSPDTDTSWYDYSNKEWANAKTSDGSYWVWIPRYVYKISTNWHSSTTGTIDVQFSIGTDDTRGGTVTLDTGATSNASNNKWTNNSAFIFGDKQLTGFWIAKFQASAPTNSSCYTSPNSTNCNVTNLLPRFVPNANSWAWINEANTFTILRNIETNNTYGWGTNGTGIDTHMIKNVEWGAAAYLSKSVYGKNIDEVWTNPNNVNITGCAGDGASVYNYSSCFAYETTNGVKASTTGNVYGVYDMAGGLYEMTAAYVDNKNASLNTYGSSIINADAKYKDVYTPGFPDNQANNYPLMINYKNDAVYETSSDPNGGYSWFSDGSSVPSAGTPWFVRGGSYINTTSAGIFSNSYCVGESNNINGFRSVLLVRNDL